MSANGSMSGVQTRATARDARRRFEQRIASLHAAQQSHAPGVAERSALLEHAQALLEQGHSEGAEVVLRALTRMEPDSAHLWTCLGAVALRAERWRDAVDALQRAVELDAESTAAAAHLGEALLCAGDPAAGAALRRTVRLDPEGDDRFANRARMLLAGTANGGTAHLESEG